MAKISWNITLRDLFWLVLLVGVVAGWGVERHRVAMQVAKLSIGQHWSDIQTINGPGAAAIERFTLRKRLHELTDEQLLAELPGMNASNEFECILTEMIHRKMVPELKNLSDGNPDNALILTALRRAQGAPDPLQIHLEIPDRNDQGKPLPFAKIVAFVVSSDSNEQRLIWRTGVDHYTSRDASWRIELTDNWLGSRVADSDYRDGHARTLRSHHLAPGETAPQVSMYAQDYVSPPASGRYRLQVFQSAWDIAREPDTNGLILMKSQPIDVIVENRASSTFQVAAFPLLAIMGVIGAIYLLQRISQRCQKSPPTVARSKFSWRDGIAAGLVLTLFLGWSLDVVWLNLQLERLQPDSAAHWTIKLAK